MKAVLCLIFILSGLTLKAQDKSDVAVSQIELLKKGALLVGLKTGELQIKALDKEAAQAYLKKVETENKTIIEAFRKNYHFSPVYFFYTSCSENITAKNLAPCMLNDQLQRDTTLNSLPQQFLTAEFGFTDEQSIEGLIIMDDHFKQLREPFPFLIRRYSGVATKLTPAEMVIKLNKAFSEFYARR